MNISYDILPPGTILAFAGPANKIPDGFLLCNGTAVSRSVYAALFDAIGIAWGYGDQITTFNLPYTEGVFLRGVNNAQGTDPDAGSRIPSGVGGNSGNNVGSYQDHALQSHNHVQRYGNAGGAGGSRGDAGSSTPLNSPISTTNSGGNETRPRNVYVNYIVKF
jgi:microcystin-dependent protein